MPSSYHVFGVSFSAFNSSACSPGLLSKSLPGACVTVFSQHLHHLLLIVFLQSVKHRKKAPSVLCSENEQVLYNCNHNTINF